MLMTDLKCKLDWNLEIDIDGNAPYLIAEHLYYKDNFGTTGIYRIDPPMYYKPNNNPWIAYNTKGNIEHEGSLIDCLLRCEKHANRENE